jgi:hypothetical protein
MNLKKIWKLEKKKLKNSQMVMIKKNVEEEEDIDN